MAILTWDERDSQRSYWRLRRLPPISQSPRPLRSNASQARRQRNGARWGRDAHTGPHTWIRGCRIGGQILTEGVERDVTGNSFTTWSPWRPFYGTQDSCAAAHHNVFTLSHGQLFKGWAVSGPAPPSRGQDDSNGSSCLGAGHPPPLAAYQCQASSLLMDQSRSHRFSRAILCSAISGTTSLCEMLWIRLSLGGSGVCRVGKHRQ